MTEQANETFLAQIGNHSDQQTGAISAPIHLSTTYAHPKLGQSTGYDYTRTKNPTRTIVEEALAKLENGKRAVVTSSGMSAIQLVFGLFPQGATFLVGRDIYGGSYRYFDYLEKQKIATFRYFNDFDELLAQLDEQVDAVFLETPTNPLMHVFDIAAVAKKAQANQATLIVDNTFLTPLRQKPLDLGADIVIHSGTKYLAGHNDLLAGVVVAKEEKIGEQLVWLANTTGPTLDSFDSWLFIRSLKTLAIRLDRQEENAQKIAEALRNNGAVKEVLYPEIGGMISIRVKNEAKIPEFLSRLSVFTFAESLGGVESLITYPVTQTHADIPKELRDSYGLTEDLLRLSIGIESADDLIADLAQALSIL
ncbi:MULTISPECIES: PLP-dependent transferase [Enterococcus]|uniref:PLP-dependent transferase n=1 Tax=Enterococcus TaxID=1350 RepID=UPI00065E0554|nr:MULTISPECIES: PLP-dependent transferase [Enterococcus]KAF1302258.1 cystathionine gamma-synthase [Enterococcus sp. JM9B]